MHVFVRSATASFGLPAAVEFERLLDGTRRNAAADPMDDALRALPPAAVAAGRTAPALRAPGVLAFA
jgi:hypothetical protein